MRGRIERVGLTNSVSGTAFAYADGSQVLFVADVNSKSEDTTTAVFVIPAPAERRV